MRSRRACFAALACAAAVALLAACTPPEAGAESLLVLAASSLSGALPELAARFEAESGTHVELGLGATGSLAAQIEHGAPGDVFLAADEASVERLVGRGLLRPATVRTYATGRLVVVWREGVAPPASPAALAEARYEVVAIANPEHAPYGAAAREALARLGVWAAVEPRVVYAESVLQAYQLVRTGNADVGLVARSVVAAAAPDGRGDYVSVDPRLHAPVRQVAGVLAQSTHPAAARFLDFVAGAAGQAILARHGFAPSAAP